MSFLRNISDMLGDDGSKEYVKAVRLAGMSDQEEAKERLKEWAYNSGKRQLTLIDDAFKNAILDKINEGRKENLLALYDYFKSLGVM